MFNVRATIVLSMSVLLAACARTEYIEIRPRCEPVVAPSLPIIDRGELWDKLGDDQYRTLERYINSLWAYADEQAAVIDGLCSE